MKMIFPIALLVCVLSLGGCAAPSDSISADTPGSSSSTTDAAVDYYDYVNSKPIHDFNQVSDLISEAMESAQEGDYVRTQEISDEINELSDAVIYMDGVPSTIKDVHVLYIDAAGRAETIGLNFILIALGDDTDDVIRQLEDDTAAMTEDFKRIRQYTDEMTDNL